jgi:hypothetical protein
MAAKKLKIALIRDSGYPIGTAAPLHAKCGCGAVITGLDFRHDFKCPLCLAEYSPSGWLREGVKKP